MRIQALYGLKKKEIGSKSVSHNSGYSYLDIGFGKCAVAFSGLALGKLEHRIAI